VLPRRLPAQRPRDAPPKKPHASKPNGRAAEEAARIEAERRAAEEAARAEAERLAAEEAARAQTERRAAEQAAQAEAERAAAAAAAARAQPPVAAARARRPEETLVMVADDSKVVRVKTSRLLAAHRYRVVLAEDGDQAARLIEEEVPLVLITDVEMPGLDGFALTRHVRSHPRAKDIAIIMVTSADDRLKEAAAEAGVTLVLGKPYEEAALLACIEQAQNLNPAPVPV
jgi:CheY-like chemotaxis protein